MGVMLSLCERKTMSIGRFFKPEAHPAAARTVVLCWAIIVAACFALGYCGAPTPVHIAEAQGPCPAGYRLITDKYGQPVRFQCLTEGM